MTQSNQETDWSTGKTPANAHYRTVEVRGRVFTDVIATVVVGYHKRLERDLEHREPYRTLGDEPDGIYSSAPFVLVENRDSFPYKWDLHFSPRGWRHLNGTPTFCGATPSECFEQADKVMAHAGYTPEEPK